MIRKHESDISWKAGMLALAVHGALFVAMVVSINWKAAHPPMNITEVELWDNLPTKVAKPIAVKPPPPPEVKEEPKPEPKPVEPSKPVEEKPEPAPPKVDIELENKKKEQALKKKIEADKKLEEAKKKAAIEKLKKEMLEDLPKPKQTDNVDKKLKELQDAMLDDKPASAQQSSSVSPSVIGEFTEKIKAKIRGNVNKTLCGDGNPELTFQISVLPTGELSGAPKLVKSSGNATCDEAVERAIIVSEPLPMPPDNAAKAEFRNLKLKFKPNGE